MRASWRAASRLVDRSLIGGQLHFDVVSSRVGVRATPLRRAHQLNRLNRLTFVVDGRQRDVELDGKLESSFLSAPLGLMGVCSSSTGPSHSWLRVMRARMFL